MILQRLRRTSKAGMLFALLAFLCCLAVHIQCHTGKLLPFDADTGNTAAYLAPLLEEFSVDSDETPCPLCQCSLTVWDGFSGAEIPFYVIDLPLPANTSEPRSAQSGGDLIRGPPQSSLFPHA